MTKRFQIDNITSESINENEVGLCQYHYRVSCHSISMSNINCQMSQHINVKSISMSNVKCHVSNIKCRMSNQLILGISVDLMRPQKILGDLSRSYEISTRLYYSQSVQIRLAHRLYKDRYSVFLGPQGPLRVPS